MLTRKFKKFFKKTKAGTKQKQLGRSKNIDRDQFAGCFKCGKMDRIIKNYPQLKEEQESDHPRGSSESKEEIAPGRDLQESCLLLGGTLLMKKKGLTKKKKKL